MRPGPKVVATTRCGPVTSAILEARSPPMMAPPLSTNRNESEPFALYPAFSHDLGQAGVQSVGQEEAGEAHEAEKRGAPDILSARQRSEADLLGYGVVGSICTDRQWNSGFRGNGASFLDTSASNQPRGRLGQFEPGEWEQEHTNGRAPMRNSPRHPMESRRTIARTEAMTPPAGTPL